MSGAALLRNGWRHAYTRSAIHPSSLIGTALQQQRCATQVSPNYKGANRPSVTDEKPAKEEKVAPVVYEGVMADTLRRVKVLSLTTCCLSVAGPTVRADEVTEVVPAEAATPIHVVDRIHDVDLAWLNHSAMQGGPFVTFFTSPDLSVIAKGAMASLMVMLSATTTGALHWFASPYVRKLTWTPGSNEMEVEVLSWMATPLRRKINLSDVMTPTTQRPAVTFAANGNMYYIDKDTFPNAELLKKLARK